MGALPRGSQQLRRSGGIFPTGTRGKLGGGLCESFSQEAVGTGLQRAPQTLPSGLMAVHSLPPHSFTSFRPTHGGSEPSPCTPPVPAFPCQELRRAGAAAHGWAGAWQPWLSWVVSQSPWAAPGPLSGYSSRSLCSSPGGLRQRGAEPSVSDCPVLQVRLRCPSLPSSQN